jgi:hypothetical protein
MQHAKMLQCLFKFQSKGNLKKKLKKSENIEAQKDGGKLKRRGKSSNINLPEIFDFKGNLVGNSFRF